MKKGSLGTKWGTYSSLDFLDLKAREGLSAPWRSGADRPVHKQGCCVTIFHLSLLLTNSLSRDERDQWAGHAVKEFYPVMRAGTEAARIGHLLSRHFTDAIARLGPCVCSPQVPSKPGRPNAAQTGCLGCPPEWQASAVGKCAEALSDCQLPPLWALPSSQAAGPFLSTPGGVAASGTAGLLEPPGNGLLPRGYCSCWLSAKLHGSLSSQRAACLPSHPSSGRLTAQSL